MRSAQPVQRLVASNDSNVSRLAWTVPLQGVGFACVDELHTLKRPATASDQPPAVDS